MNYLTTLDRQKLRLVYIASRIEELEQIRIDSFTEENWIELKKLEQERREINSKLNICEQ